MITRDKCKSDLSAARAPLGKLVSRRLKSAQYTTSLPGARDGKFVMIQFSASFKNQRNAIETITPMQESDGSWRVAGYYVK